MNKFFIAILVLAQALTAAGQNVHNGHKYVDLGLSVKWATCNVGASKPEDCGGYYQWAGTKDVSDKSIYLDWSNCPYHLGSDGTKGWTKYVSSVKSSYWYGTDIPDNKTLLDPSDDAAHVEWGGSWRMPTDEEWTELRNTDNCLWTWTSINGMNGYKVQSKKSGYTDKWIFLPAAGYRNFDGLDAVGYYGNYWSSSLNSDSPRCAYYMYFSSAGVYWHDILRDGGQSVRPVYDCRHILECVPMRSPTEASSGCKEAYRCKKCGMYFEDKDGLLLIGGEQEYQAWKSKGGNGVLPRIGEYVDLGLPSGLKWATCNVGASKPEECGRYYQWAGVTDVSDKTKYLYKGNCPYHIGEYYSSGWTKYVRSSDSAYWSGEDTPDDKVVLDPDDDIAHVELGGDWRMPTFDELEELRSECSWTWTTMNGMNGFVVRSRKPGYTNNWIFLPAAGIRFSDNLDDVGFCGCYWSSSLADEYSSDAKFMSFFPVDFFMGACARYYGYSVRPVYSCRHNLECISRDSPSEYVSGWKEAYKCKECGLYFEDVDGRHLIGGKQEYIKWTSVGGDGFLPLTGSRVDLGLSVKWATCNVGASKPEDYGGYYQWAGIKDVSDKSIYLDWSNCPYHTDPSSYSSGWVKYVFSDKPSYWSGAGNPDDKMCVDPDDDIATIEWGSNWRMPTPEEWQELIDECTWTWITMNGVYGYKIQSRKPGYTDKWIFLPAAGKRGHRYLYDVNTDGLYWSSTRDIKSTTSARALYFCSNRSLVFYYGRYNGFSVRPVSE